MAIAKGSTSIAIAKDGRTVQVPEEFVCPITLCVMRYPMMNRGGHNFERHAILTWLKTSKHCPLTRKPMYPSDLVRNHALEGKLRAFLVSNDIADDTFHCERAECWS